MNKKQPERHAILWVFSPRHFKGGTRMQFTIQQIRQDLRECQQICDQLSQGELNNAQQLRQFQQPGLQAMASNEQRAAGQLQQLRSIFGRIEQQLSQLEARAATMPSYGIPPQTYHGYSTAPQYGYAGVAAPAIQQVLQADHQQQWGIPQTPQPWSAAGQYPPAMTYAQPLHTPQAATYTPGIQQVMAADRNLSEPGPSHRYYS
jgi:hypothetical protein